MISPLSSKFFRSCIVIILVQCLSVGAIAQNKTLGVGTPTPNPNAALHVESPTNNQGFLMPRMTTAQRNAAAFTSALSIADNGLMIYDSNIQAVYVWEGSQWSAVSTLDLPYADTLLSAPNGSNLLRLVYAGSATENVGIAQFENMNPNNGFTPLFARTNSATNGAVDLVVNNVNNNNDAIGVVTNGLGTAGRFTINNPSNASSAIYATTNGTGGSTSAAIVGETATAFSAIIGRATGGAANAISGISTDPGAGSFAILGSVSATGGGQAGVFTIGNTANPNNTLEATTQGTGGAGKFKVTNVASTMPALWAETNSNQPLSAPIFGLNTGTGDVAASFKINNGANNFSALYAETNGKRAGHFVKTAGTGPAVYIDSQTGGGLFANHNGPTGYAGIIQTINTSNTSAALYAESAGAGPSIWALKSTDAVSGDAFLAQNEITSGSAGSFEIINPANTSASVYAETIGSGAAVYGKNTGAGNGFGGLFEVTNATNTYPAIQAKSKGTGPAIRAIQEPTDGPGPGIESLMLNTSGNASGLVVDQKGLGDGGFFSIDNTSSTNAAVKGRVTNTGGVAGSFEVFNASNGKDAIFSITQGTGAAGSFNISNTSSTNNALRVTTNGTGTTFLANHTGASGDVAVFQVGGSNVARIGRNGIGYFNGGTQNSGADIAEMFDVEGAKENYEPGDVLVISESTDRTVEKSSQPNSRKVVGVYATKPGVILTEKDMDADFAGMVPMGVIGVIPTKVCLENGVIKRGDLLVSSSEKGKAMKAIPAVINGIEIYPQGAILGKALENYDGTGKALIEVLVNTK